MIPGKCTVVKYPVVRLNSYLVIEETAARGDGGRTVGREGRREEKRQSGGSEAGNEGGGKGGRKRGRAEEIREGRPLVAPLIEDRKRGSAPRYFINRGRSVRLCLTRDK